ncbi:MAG: YhfC family glutamic-type intramembrane protease [Clostridium sp.]|nr:YhfC family glutamic-type intramembrane protease [Clostridium sp.]
MISVAVFAAMAVTVLLCYLVPVMLCWAAGRREKKIIVCILLGAFGFAAPQLLIRIPALQLLGMAAAVQRFQRLHTALYCLLLAFSAALLETAGRVLVFGVLLKKRRSYWSGFAAGVGHGGVEAIALVGRTYVIQLILALLLIAGVSLPEELIRAFAPMLKAPAAAFLLAGAERVFAMLFQIALSLIVCRYAMLRRLWVGALIALLLHTAMDFAAAWLGATGCSVLLIEGMLAAAALLALVYIRRIRRHFPIEAHPDYAKKPQADRAASA